MAIARGLDFYGLGVLIFVMGDRFFPAVLADKTASAVGNLSVPHIFTFITLTFKEVGSLPKMSVWEIHDAFRLAFYTQSTGNYRNNV